MGNREPSSVVPVADISLNVFTRDELEDYILRTLAKRQGGRVVTANLAHFAVMHRVPETRSFLAEADIVVADGAPLLWASRWTPGPTLPMRITGSELIFTLTRKACANGIHVHLVGGKQGAATLAGKRLDVTHPELIHKHELPQNFIPTANSASTIAERIRDTSPSLVFVGLGFPKQDKLIEHLYQQAPQAWYIGCGVAIEIAAGYVNRSPLWMQRVGLEWLFRFFVEPKKLWRRYFLQYPPTFVRLLIYALKTQLNRRRTRPNPSE